MASRRRLQAAQPFPILGKIGKQSLAVVHELCAPGEQPRFVLAEGVYGALAAFADRLAIIKKGPAISWLSGARGKGLLQTFPYAEIAELRYVAHRFSGTLEIVSTDDLDGREVYWRQHSDPQKRSDAIQMSPGLYDKAWGQFAWLRDQIADPPRPPTRALDGDDDETIHSVLGRQLIELVRDPAVAAKLRIATPGAAPGSDLDAERWRAAGEAGDPWAAMRTVIPDVADAVLVALLRAVDDGRLELGLKHPDGAFLDLTGAADGELSSWYFDWLADYTSEPGGTP